MSKLDRIIDGIRKQGRTVLTEIESKHIIKEASISTIETVPASSEKEAIAVSDDIGFPVVLKVASPDITHKSDAGGVKIGLRNKAEVREAYREIMVSARQKHPGAGIDGVSVQKMARPGIEVIIGMFRDFQFGPVIMFGLGGIFVEALKDVSFRVIPIVRRDAAEMIKEIKGYSLLRGYRGQEPANLRSLEDILLKVSALVEETPGVKEIDLNPVFAYKDGAMAVDARIVLEDEAAGLD